MSIQEIPINSISPAWVCLRPVREDSVEYLEMVDSIKENGLLNSILVRPHPSRRGVYEVIDGMWRYSVCKYIGMDDMPCIIKEGVTDEEVLSLQIQANAVSYITRPIEFAHQMRRVLRLRESVGAPITLIELGKLVSKSSVWVSGRLRLLNLHDDLQEEIREGNMGMGKASALARINTTRYQLQLWKKHKDKSTRDFEIAVALFIQEKFHRKSEYYHEEFIALKPALQSLDSMLIELDRLDIISQIIVSKGLTTAYEGAKAAIEWAVNLHEQGRKRQVHDKRFILNHEERRELIGRQRYEELEEIRSLREEKEDLKMKRINKNQLGETD